MLRPLAPDIWEVTDDLFLPGGLHFPVRMTVVRLADGGLWLHSPLAIDDSLATDLAAVGPVRFVVAPSKLHHLFLAAAAARYPDAQVWAAPGLREKLPELPITHVLGEDRAAWSEDLTLFPLQGVPWMNECMFLHRASGTALATDLFFHMVSPANWGSRLFFWLIGVLGQAKQSPIVRLQTRDRAAAGASLAALLAQRPTRFVVAHGPPITEDVDAGVRDACSWMLGGVTPRITAAAG